MPLIRDARLLFSFLAQGDEEEAAPKDLAEDGGKRGGGGGGRDDDGGGEMDGGGGGHPEVHQANKLHRPFEIGSGGDGALLQGSDRHTQSDDGKAGKMIQFCSSRYDEKNTNNRYSIIDSS